MFFDLILFSCISPGDFALTLKQRLGTKINYTGLDPSDDIDKAKAKLNGSDIDFIKGDLFEHQFDSKYDVVLFTKSLHHCNPVEKAVKIAYDLLEQNGIFFAEEFNPDRLNTQDKYWHIERLDLLLATGCFIPAEERLENAGHIKKFLSAFLDTRLPVEERFMLGRNHHHQHGDQHHHGHGGHPSAHEDQQHTHGDHQLHHSHEQKEHNKKLHRDDPEGIAPFNQVISVVEKQFGKDIVKSMSVPFFYHFLVLSGYDIIVLLY